MRMVCIYTKEHDKSVTIAERCVDSAQKFGYEVEMYPAVYFKNMDEIHEKYNLKKKYEPIVGAAINTKTACPASRMANGTTHYLLYKWTVENNKSICIVEHDSVFVDKIPEAEINGVIQISSHSKIQMDEVRLSKCRRAQRMRKYQPNFEYKWDAEEGVIRHPLTGINGTSGYIIHPGAAQKMIDYVEREGIANADRIRTEWVGDRNLYLQVPQSVLCYHDVRSMELK